MFSLRHLSHAGQDCFCSQLRILQNNKLVQMYIEHTSSFVSTPEGTAINVTPAVSAVMEKHYGSREQIEKKIMQRTEKSGK